MDPEENVIENTAEEAVVEEEAPVEVTPEEEPVMEDAPVEDETAPEL